MSGEQKNLSPNLVHRNIGETSILNEWPETWQTMETPIWSTVYFSEMSMNNTTVESMKEIHVLSDFLRDVLTGKSKIMTIILKEIHTVFKVKAFKWSRELP